MKMYSFTETDMQINANLVKDVLLRALENDGVIAEGEAVSLGSKYAVLVGKKGFFGQIYDKIRGRNDDEPFFTCVKFVEFYDEKSERFLDKTASEALEASEDIGC